jgi:GntR family transcriptional regulator
MASTTEARPRRRPAVRGGKPSRQPPLPLYLQLLETLKDEILKGVHAVGTQLPTEEVLCARFDVSRYTVREALRRLRDAHLVSSRQGAGTTVLRPAEADSYVHEVTSISDLAAFATGVRYRVGSRELVASNRALAARLGGRTGQQWLLLRGYRYEPGSELPVCWTEVYVNADYAGVGRLVARHDGPIFELIEDLYGERIGEVHQELHARSVPPELVAGLQVAPDATVIEVRRTYRLLSGKIAQVAFNLHPAERFRLSMSLRRIKPGK